jgi:hypothetical protein
LHGTDFNPRPYFHAEATEFQKIEGRDALIDTLFRRKEYCLMDKSVVHQQEV